LQPGGHRFDPDTLHLDPSQYNGVQFGRRCA
jgi:hypothetical protein